MIEFSRQTARVEARVPQPLAIKHGDRELEALLGALLAIGVVDGEPVGRAAVDVVGVFEAGGYLRPYQAEACKAALEAPYGRAVIEAPTGSGKTRMSAVLAQAGGGRWVYLAPNKVLAQQTQKEMPSSVVCSTFGSVSDSTLKHCDGLIIDECHRLAAQTYRKCLMITQALYRIGLSATPLLRQDDRNALVIGLLGPVVASIGLKTLQKEGFLARGSVISVTI